MRWTVRERDPVAAAELGRAVGVGPSTAQVLLHRGLADEPTARDFLDPRLVGLSPPHGMADREAAIERIAAAVRGGERVAIFGDYDVDGTTATAILSDVLEAAGADFVPLLANRFDGGYGFSDRALARCLEAGSSLIVTCDCGSSDHERIAAARRRGVDVVVVDHHLVPAEPLPAVAFLNPHRPDCRYPFDGLASAGLALVVAAGLRAALRLDYDVRQVLDLVALGTIADVAPLRDDNRRLVRAGLARLRHPDVRPGVAALRALAVRFPEWLTSRDVSFGLAPRLNAPGRLGDPTASLRLLRTRSPTEARALAAAIDADNERRRALQREIADAAVAQVRDVYGDAPAGGVVAAGAGWHPGVLGIVAARLSDSLGVPALALGIEGGVARGSGRAPDGFDLHAAVGACASHLTRWGGHAAAVGLEAHGDALDALRADFGAACTDAGVPPSRRAVADVLLDGGDYPLPPPEDLDRLEPLGEGNPTPLFAVPGARVERVRCVGAEDAHLALTVRVGRRALRAFVPGKGSLKGDVGERIDLLGALGIDAFGGGRDVEMRVEDLDVAAVPA